MIQKGHITALQSNHGVTTKKWQQQRLEAAFHQVSLSLPWHTGLDRSGRTTGRRNQLKCKSSRQYCGGMTLSCLRSSTACAEPWQARDNIWGIEPSLSHAPGADHAGVVVRAAVVPAPVVAHHVQVLRMSKNACLSIDNHRTCRVAAALNMVAVRVQVVVFDTMVESKWSAKYIWVPMQAQ